MVQGSSPVQIAMTANASWKASPNQFQPRSQSKFLGSVSLAGTSPSAVAGITRARESFAAKPLLPDEDLQGIEEGFASLIRGKIATAKIYPPASRRAGHEGKVLIAFTLSKAGQILELSIDRSSGHESLDQAAMQAIKTASPYPPIPEKLGRESIAFKLPISFNLR